MSEEPATVEKNFRSSYYKSLGFRSEEKNLSQLEGLIRADKIDLNELRAFCLKYTLASCYRSSVWKVLTGVSPVYTDEDTCSFVGEQKRQQYYDLKHALLVMGRMDNPNSQRRKTSAGDQVVETSQLLQFHQASASKLLSVPSNSHHQPSLVVASSTQLMSPSVATSQVKREAFGNLPDSSKVHRTIAPAVISDSSSLAHSLLPEHLVLIYLLENNRLLLSSINQMKQQPQVNLVAIARVILLLFAESEYDMYWLFSGFAKLWETKLSHVDKMRGSVAKHLKEIDPALYDHLRVTNAFDEGIPYNRWFGQCFACDLPESSLRSVWDKVIGGSSMLVVFVAVSTLLSARKRLLCVRMVRDIRCQLETLPRENYPVIVNQALEMWESSGSHLDPL